EIDANRGLMLSVTDPNGNRLTYSDGGVTSSAGPSVTFGRDPQGRITTVTDPAGQQVRYQYDAAGNLASVTDRGGSTTRFVYRTTPAHYIDQVIDPLGRAGVRTEYDAQGRLARMLDASGNPVQLAYDPDSSVQTVRDALGN